MLLNRQRSDLTGGARGEEAGLPRTRISGTVEATRISQVPGTSGGAGSSDHLRFGVTSAASRPARWTWRNADADDRKVFNVWALWVTGFYASLAIALLAAMSWGIGG